MPNTSDEYNTLSRGGQRAVEAMASDVVAKTTSYGTETPDILEAIARGLQYRARELRIERIKQIEREIAQEEQAKRPTKNSFTAVIAPRLRRRNIVRETGSGSGDAA